MGGRILKKLIKGPIYFYGASGMGKTTIAEELSHLSGLPIVSVSYLRHIGKDTQGEAMQYMSIQGKEDLVQKEYQFFTNRANTFKEATRVHHNKFISDRSYFDNLAFFILKASAQVPSCEVDNFRDLIRRAMFAQNNYSMVADPGYIIYIPYGKTQIDNGWTFDHNGKRITNKYFQAMVGGVMDSVLEFFKDKTYEPPLIYCLFGMRKYIKYIPAFGSSIIPVLTIDTTRNDGNNKRQIIRRFIIFLIIEAWRKRREKRQ